MASDPSLSKHFVNDAEVAVLGSLESAVLQDATLAIDKQNKIVYRKPSSVQGTDKKVSLVCGGGSGHEPAWAGFVGRGMLTAAVAGTIFASPNADQVVSCLESRLPRPSIGTLVIVKNYTGDVLNFGQAVARFRAQGNDINHVVVADDVGVGREKSGKVGRRGMAGTVLVVKLVGALAEAGGSLQDCTRLANLIQDNIVTVSISLARTHVPGRPSSDATEEQERLPAGKVELGMGIHNEPGCDQLTLNLGSNIQSMLKQLLDMNDQDRAYVDIQSKKSDQVVLFVNNMGGLSNIELGAVTAEASRQLHETYSLTLVRVIQGSFVTSLNGLGFSLTLLKVQAPGLTSGPSILQLLDAPTSCAAWPVGTSTVNGISPSLADAIERDDNFSQPPPSSLCVDPVQYSKILTAGLQRAISVEPEVTRFDSIVGDGDCGIGLKRGAETVLAALQTHKPGEDLVLNVLHIVWAVEKSMDGTSGALYAIFLNSLVHSLRAQGKGRQAAQVDARIWSEALKESLVALEQYTPAKVGDRTMLDALIPFVDALAASGSLKEAATSAEKGAEATKGMKASLGRAVYVGGEGFKEVPDPGAYGLAALLHGFADSA